MAKTLSNKLSAASLVPVSAEVVERRIFYIRERKVMLDRDLAEL
jgi:hypothetical protein